MAGMIVTGSQIGKDGILGFDCGRSSCRPYGIQVSRTPFVVGVDLSANSVRFVGLRRHGCGSVCACLGRNSDNVLARSGVVEKEFEFKPSFDEYVKAMESIKTVREKRGVDKLDKSRDGFGEIEEELGRRSMDRDMVSGSGDGDVVRRQEIQVNGKGRYVEPKHSVFKFKDDLDGEERNWGSELKRGRWSKHERDGVESRGTRSMKRISKREEAGARGNGTSSGVRSNPVEVDNVVRSKSPYKYGRTDDLDGDESNRGSEMKRGRWPRHEEDSVESRLEDRPRDMRSMKRISNREEIDVRGNESNRGSEMKRGRWPRHEEDSVESRLEDRPRDMRSMKRISNREEIDVRGNGTSSGFRSSPVEVDNGVRGKSPHNYVRTKDLEDELDGDESNSGLMVGRAPGGHVMLEKQGTHYSPEGKESVDRTFKREGNATSSRFHINPIQVKKVTGKDYTSTHGRLTRTSRTFFDKGDSLKTERASFKSFEEASYMKDKPRGSRMEMEERIQKLANCLNGANIHMPEWMFSKMMQSAKIDYSDQSVLRIVQLLGKLGNWRRVLQVIEWLQLRERYKSYKLRYIYSAALSALQRARRPVEALNVFRVMQQQWSSYPDLVAYHTIAVTLGQAGHMKELFGVIDSMRCPPKKSFRTRALDDRDPRMEPDIIVYNAVLNACVQRKQWEGAFWVLQQLKKQGIAPSSGTYGLVMEVMFVCGKYKLVHEFFKKMQRSSAPNALTYRVLVNTLWKEGRIDETVSTVQDMERRGIVGSAALYYDFARCLCSVGRCEEALMQIEKICKVASKPLVVTYTGIIQACLDSGNIQNGSYIFNRMHKFCSPNLVTCNIMLKAYLDHAMFEEAKKLFQKMLENGNHITSKLDYKTRVIPDIYTFNTMLDACFTEKRWDEFAYFYQRMLYHGFRFNARRHLRMILDASNTKKGDLVEITWKYLARNGRVPPSALAKERLCMMLEKNDHAAAMACITSNHGESELYGFSKHAWLNLLKENGERFDKDSLVQFIDVLSVHSSGSDSSNPVFLNLLTACKEHVRTHFILTELY